MSGPGVYNRDEIRFIPNLHRPDIFNQCVCACLGPIGGWGSLQQVLIEQIASPDIHKFSHWLAIWKLFLTPEEIEFLKVQFKKPQYREVIKSYLSIDTKEDIRYRYDNRHEFSLIFILWLLSEADIGEFTRYEFDAEVLYRFNERQQTNTLPSGIVTMQDPLSVVYPTGGGNFLIVEETNTRVKVSGGEWQVSVYYHLNEKDANYIQTLSRESIDRTFHMEYRGDVPTPTELKEQSKRNILYAANSVISTSDVKAVNYIYGPREYDSHGSSLNGIRVKYKYGGEAELEITDKTTAAYIFNHLVNKIDR